MSATPMRAAPQAFAPRELLAKLRCPDCRGRLTERAPDAIFCRACGRAFPFVRGAPCLFPEGSFDGPEAVERMEADPEADPHPAGSDYHWRVYGIDDLLPDPAEGNEVLLLGCGDGGERRHLEDRGFRVTGFDVRWSPGTDFLADAHRIALADESYDVVLHMQVFEHLHSPWVAMDEVARVLRPGGWCIGSVAFLKPFHGSYFHISHQGMTRLLEGAGLEVDRLSGAQSLTYTLYGGMFPVGSVRLRRALGGLVDRSIAWLREKYWAVTRRADPRAPTDRFGSAVPLSFRAFDRLRYAPAVVFRARKPPARS